MSFSQILWSNWVKPIHITTSPYPSAAIKNTVDLSIKSPTS